MIKTTAKEENYPFVLELDSAEEVNEVDLSIYRFERYSETKGKYIFVKRSR